tara:strand:- start:3091 stop:3441 length:351 start_codon:yes stop_codon:yes gene_type:complete
LGIINFHSRFKLFKELILGLYFIYNMIKIDPKKYNLSTRIVLFKRNNEIIIVLDRKSRIIMKDGHRIIDQFQSIQNIEPGVSVSVFTSAPVCSKTRSYLNKNGIELMDLDELILPE